MHETATINPARLAAAEKKSQPVRSERPFLGFMALCGEVLDVSPRKGADIIKEPWFPESIPFGPRCRKWNRLEVIDAITSRAPRTKVQAEPPQLAAARAGKKAA